MELEGVYPALITPFDREDNVDEKGFKENIDYMIRNGVSGIVPCGTTGESATLSYEEHKRVIELAVKASDGRVPVMAGTGSNSTREAIELTGYAEDVGVDIAMVITPYYNKPTAAGLIKHYREIASTVNIPIVIYNVPSRTGTNIKPETVATLSREENIIGIKEASGDINQVSRVINKTTENFTVMSGDDSMTLPIIALGGKGVVSVAANLAPERVSMMVEAALNNNMGRARKLHHELMPLFDTLFIETNPIPVKTGANMIGLAAGKLRSPMAEMENGNKQKLKNVLQDLDLTK
ncbi:4-hydroxy-tetrahydrodipicolinate synthase [Methanonatronarchaeum sp. AMET6-2]|uniref:4-hydroxy-tetrahydrodipicolinate synthase n=1 Tax=Methanonatronarchaeum sp. AMET6-2 TaxID=2933293 RepID=UPI001FF5FE84|nr:4-hydroxy-tetrahydrodipicolinate synthase [Methanonatronarchaeum sp. AMET6-2]UOY09656.1 4-hydroxy-tetrahydrodipicolinate synthase [Methanonatronarchaeum sp. AMET6-2]